MYATRQKRRAVSASCWVVGGLATKKSLKTDVKMEHVSKQPSAVSRRGSD